MCDESPMCLGGINIFPNFISGISPWELTKLALIWSRKEKKEKNYQNLFTSISMFTFILLEMLHVQFTFCVYFWEYRCTRILSIFNWLFNTKIPLNHIMTLRYFLNMNKAFASDVTVFFFFRCSVCSERAFCAYIVTF